METDLLRVWVKGAITTYDPMLIAVASSMHSRLPNRDNDRYWHINLPPLPDSKVCPNRMKAYVKLSRTDSPYTFVILPGAYATWKRGSFNNQTIAALNKRFNDPSIISFDGYLSFNFLEGTCNKIPWDAMSIAEDMYSRLKIYLDALQVDSRFTGIVGYSGGGGLAPFILAEDALSAQNGEQRFFELGGAVFSPTLHGRVIFNNLDESVKGIPHNSVLTVLDSNIRTLPGQLSFFANAILNDGSLNWRDVVSFYEDDPQMFLERSRNQFVFSDLADTLEAVGVNENMVRGDFGYYSAYINTGFRNDRYPTIECPNHVRCSQTPDGKIIPYINSQQMGFLYDQETDIRPVLEKIDRPLFIYFSQDDPALSSWDASGQPQTITEILDHAKSNPHIVVFNPQYGGHIGNFLDPIFDELLYTVFSQK